MDAFWQPKWKPTPLFLFFIFFMEDPYNTDGRVVTSVGGLCFGLFARVRLGIE
jgi:hypothetical protein